MGRRDGQDYGQRTVPVVTASYRMLAIRFGNGRTAAMLTGLWRNVEKRGESWTDNIGLLNTQHCRNLMACSMASVVVLSLIVECERSNVVGIIRVW